MAVATKRRTDVLRESIAPFLQFFSGPIGTRLADPDVANFAVGNPQEMPLPSYVAALQRHLVPQDKDWFAYKLSEPKAQAAAARTLSARTGMEWDPEDVAMTNGGFGALAVSLRAVLEPGDEVIFLSPPWFFYELLILAADGEPVRVRLTPPAFDLDVEGIARAITPRTRAVLVNSPHNPSGKVYSEASLRALGDVLQSASDSHGRPIYLVSDEPYNRIVFDGRTYTSPAQVYPNTVTTYSYGKTLLAPGMRIGFATVPPTMPDREDVRDRIQIAQLANGFLFPNALLQHAIEDLEGLSIDIGAIERRRDRMVPALRSMGYQCSMPEGTFYLMAKAPTADDLAFCRALADNDALVLPGTVVEVPGWFRISLTASDAMVDRGLPAFERTLNEWHG